jgi:hypothetical protein
MNSKAKPRAAAARNRARLRPGDTPGLPRQIQRALNAQQSSPIRLKDLPAGEFGQFIAEIETFTIETEGKTYVSRDFGDKEARRFLVAISQGMSIDKAAWLVGISEPTIHRVLKTQPRLREMLMQARAFEDWARSSLTTASRELVLRRVRSGSLGAAIEVLHMENNLETAKIKAAQAKVQVDASSSVTFDFGQVLAETQRPAVVDLTRLRALPPADLIARRKELEAKTELTRDESAERREIYKLTGDEE